MPFSVKSSRSGDDLLLELAGTLEERQALPTIKPRLAQRIVLDFNDLRYINSEGLRILGLWFQTFDRKQQFVFSRVPPRIIDTFDVVSDLLPADRIFESFYVPYACETCDNVENYLAHRGKDYVEGSADRPLKLNLPETLNCSACKQIMKVEVFESKYFLFLGPA